MPIRSLSIRVLAAIALAFPAAVVAEEESSPFKSFTLPPQMEARSAAKLLRELEVAAKSNQGHLFAFGPGVVVAEGSPALFQALEEKINGAVTEAGIPVTEVRQSDFGGLTIEHVACQIEAGAEEAVTRSGDNATTTTMAWALESQRPVSSASRTERLREHESKIRELIEARRRSKQAEADGNPGPAEAAAPVPGTSVYTGAKSGKLVTVGMNDGQIEQVAMILGAQIGTSVDVYGGAVGRRVTIIAQDKPLEDTLDSLTARNGLVWWKRDDGRYGIADKAYYESNILPATTRLEVYTAKGTKAQDLQRMLTELNLLSPNGRSSVDADNNRVAVTDTPAAHEAIRAAIAKLEGGAP